MGGTNLMWTGTFHHPVRIGIMRIGGVASCSRETSHSYSSVNKGFRK